MQHKRRKHLSERKKKATKSEIADIKIDLLLRREW